MNNKTIPVTMPDWLWGRLATIAEQRNQPIAGLVADALREVADANPRIKFERISRLGILERELVEARAAGIKAPGTHTSSKGRAA